jgi:hypothetical protein
MQDRTRSRVTAEKVYARSALVGSPRAPFYLSARVVWDRCGAAATQGLLSGRTADGGLAFRRLHRTTRRRDEASRLSRMDFGTHNSLPTPFHSRVALDMTTSSSLRHCTRGGSRPGPRRACDLRGLDADRVSCERCLATGVCRVIDTLGSARLPKPKHLPLPDVGGLESLRPAERRPRLTGSRLPLPTERSSCVRLTPARGI